MLKFFNNSSNNNSNNNSNNDSRKRSGSIQDSNGGTVIMIQGLLEPKGTMHRAIRYYHYPFCSNCCFTIIINTTMKLI